MIAVKKFCPECQKQGLKSRITVGSTYMTLAAVHHYYDEDGNYQVEDPNYTYTEYTCSNGHHWKESG